MALRPTARALMFRVSSSNPSSEPTGPGPDAVEVQFNPTSLSYSVQNTLEKKGKDAKAKQFVAQSTAKLELDLVFDSTHDGKDVRKDTNRIKQFLNPGDKSSNKDQAPPVVGFKWGTFKFKGVMESYKETLDFFSSDGVPLRSTLKLSLAAQDAKDIFTNEAFDAAAQGMADPNTQLAPLPPEGASGLANRGGGGAGAARALGVANGLESLRSSAAGGGMVAVSGGGVQLKAAVGFAPSAGAGIGLGGGLGARAGIGVSAEAGMSAGASASASVSASMGAFSGLKASVSMTTPALPSLNLTATTSRAELPAATAEFALGGKAVTTISSGLRTDVGVSARIRFD